MILDPGRITDPERVAAARFAMEFIIPPDEDLLRYSSEATRVTSAKLGFITIVFEDSHHVVAACGFPPDYFDGEGEKEGTFDQTACAYIVAAGEPLHFEDTHNFEFLKECFSLRDLRSYTAAPLVFRGRVIGAIGVGDFTPRIITKRQMHGLVKLASEVSLELKSRQD